MELLLYITSTRLRPGSRSLFRTRLTSIILGIELSFLLGHFDECNDTDVRLVGGTASVNETFGTVEICVRGIWGTVCHNSWDNADAAVVCRQLGLSSEGISLSK